MIFYDYEVFQEDWLVVFNDVINKKETVIVNDRQKLIDFHEEHEHDIYVGYNNKHYDRWIHKGIIAGFNPKEINDWIIVEGKQPWKFSSLLNKIHMYNYDIMNFNDGGLKTLEAYMGNNIHESSVDFTIERKLTEEEIEKTIEYCKYDVQQTMEVFLLRKDQFDAQMGLTRVASSGSGLDLRHLSRTDAQLSSIILNARQVERDDEFDLYFPPNLKLGKYQKVKDWYKNPDNQDYRKKLETDIAGVPHVFGWGGIHGAIPQFHGEGNYVLLDVRSMYPSLMIEHDLLSRNVQDPEYFEEIYDLRQKLKAEGNPIEVAYKLVLNTTYGAMKAKFNGLYDPRQANLVCVFGQLLLLDLIEKVEPHYKIIQSNTDGILVDMGDEIDYTIINDIIEDWEERSKLKLDIEEYTQVHQKDVNNYILVDKDGHIHSKGAYVKKLNRLDNNLPIVNKAIVDYYTKGISVEETIYGSSNLLDYQMVAKITGKFSHFLVGNEKLNEKTIRIFASKKHEEPISRIHKNGNQFKVTNAPDNVFIYNGDIKDVKAPEHLDKNYYIEMAKKRIEDFGG